MQNNGEQVPIAVEIIGHGKFGGHTIRDVALRYDFFDFRREWMPSRYQLEVREDTGRFHAREQLPFWEGANLGGVELSW